MNSKQFHMMARGIKESRIKRLGVWLMTIGTVVAAGTYLHLGTSSDGWKPPRVVRIESKEPVASLFPSWVAWLSGGEEGTPQALLLRDGDYLFAENAPIPYLASDGQVLKLDSSDWRVQIGGTTVSVMLTQDGGLEWLQKASVQELEALRTVALPAELGDADMIALKRLATANPHVNLWGESEAAMLQALTLFQPRAVFLGDDSEAALQALANQPVLETLQFEASEPGCFDVLPTLPMLRRLLIGDWDVDKVGPLPAGLTNLKTLLVVDGTGFRDLTALGGSPPALEELSLLGLKDFNDLKGIERMTSLHTLVLWGDEGLGDLASLAALTRLRWVGLPPKTSQDQFAALASTHPKLKILDLSGNKAIGNLTPVATMKGLEGLILEGPYENLNALHGLTSLRFVGIAKESWEAAPEQVAALRKALPDALVVPVKPVCLGSGWILLLVPVLVLVWFIGRRPRPLTQLAS